MWTDQSRREESANSCLMETCWPPGGVGPNFPLLLPVTDTAVFVRDKAAESTQATMSGKGWGQMLWGGPGRPAPSPHLEDPFAKFVELRGPGFPVPPSPYPRPRLHVFAHQHHGSIREREKPSLGSQSPMPARQPSGPPVLSAHSCVLTAFQPLIKCLLYRARAWSVCGGSRKLGRRNPSFNCPGIESLSWGESPRGRREGRKPLSASPISA